MVAGDNSNKSSIERAFDNRQARENNLLRGATVGEKELKPAKLRYRSRSANEAARYLLLVSAMEQKGRTLRK